MPDRDDIERLSFEPTSFQELSSGVSVASEKDLSSLPMLQCSHACCKKWRRVDGATQELFSNMSWWRDKLTDEEKQLYESCRDFDTQLGRWLRLSERSDVITMEDYKDFCKTLLSPLGCPLVESVPRALVHCFARACVEHKKQVDAEVYEAEAELWNELEGPVFHCNMLAGTSCEDPCDWHQIAEEPYDLAKLERLALGEIFVRDVSFGASGNGITVAQHNEHGSYLDPARQESDGRCTVLGCEEAFGNDVAQKKNGYEFQVNKRGRRQALWKVQGLCQHHYKSLTDWKTRGCTAELQDFHSRWPMRSDKPEEVEYMQVNFPAVPGVRPWVLAKYERAQGDRFWMLCHKATQRLCKVSDSELAALPQRASICGTDHAPVRTAKIHTTFGEKLLRRMFDAQKVLSNMVLFHCTTCNERFPTWHPHNKPDFELECLKDCSIEVQHWDDEPLQGRTRHATLHRGRCMRCYKN